jgi:hypothetical protein
MDVDIEHLTGVEAASAELDRLMAEDPAGPANKEEAATGADTQDESVLDEGQHAGHEGDDQANPDKQKETDTRAAAAAEEQRKLEARKSKSETEADKKGKTETDDKGKATSRFAKERERRLRSWDEINAEKTAVKAEREALQKQQQEFEALRKQDEEQFSPEQYERAAKAFEQEGKLEMAEAARERAKALRDNPERTQRKQAESQKLEASRKEWALKAGVDFPELAKANSPLNARVQALFTEEPELKTHPKGIYLAARLASLEAESARVPAMTADLEKLRARVKELEELTTPDNGGGAAAQTSPRAFEQLNDAQQYSELERMAQQVGSSR